MAIRKYTNPRAIDLSPGLQEVLHRNGMQAHITLTPEGQHKLVVLGHDSPVMEYNLTGKQVENLMNWGSNFADKTAYNTFVSIVKKDFSVPNSFVSARNAFGRVAMGLHGYRVGRGEYGRPEMPYYRPFNRYGRGWMGDFLGWSARMQPGYHLRRIDGRLYAPTGPVVAERPDGRLKPGELRSGAYGFYYKGGQKETRQDVLDNLSINVEKIKPLQSAPRPKGQGIPMSEVFTSDLYFSNEGFQKIAASHGILIQDANDQHEKRVVIQSGKTRVDTGYTLTDEQYAQLTATDQQGKWQDNVDARLAIINSVIAADYNSPITREMLETRELVSIDLKPEVKAELEAPFVEKERMMAEQRTVSDARMQEMQDRRSEQERIEQDPNAISGKDIAHLMPGRMFCNAEGGREMVVGEIRVDKTAGDHYIMSAVINGERVTHGINEKEYEKFLALDDVHRLKLFDRKFNELTIQKGDGRSTDDMYMQQGRTRQQQATVGEYRVRGVEKMEILDFAKKAELGSFLITGAHVLAAKEQLRVGNIKAYSINELLGRLSPEELKGISQQQLADLKDKFVLTARIDGQLLTRELTKEEFDRFNDLPKNGQIEVVREAFDINKNTTLRIEDEKVYVSAEQLDIERARSQKVDGAALQEMNAKKGFYREVAHGREVEVGEIKVERDPAQEGKYKMTAVIDGQSVTHEITQRDYDKFLAVDDMQRMKLFSKIFNEVDMKTRPVEGVNIGAAILAAVVATTDVAAGIAAIGHRPRPEIYESRIGGPMFGNEISPAAMAAANYEAERQAAESRQVQQTESHSRGI